MAPKRKFRVWRGQGTEGRFEEYEVAVDPGMVVLDVLHRIQAERVNDLAVRWNCKAGKCGSCAMEINGKPKLSCMTRMDTFKGNEPITIQPMKTFDVIKDLVTDVQWNYEQNKRIPNLKPKPRDPDGHYRMAQKSIDRIQEFRKCIECFLCQDVCHVLRDQDKKDKFVGPRFMHRLANLEMHPLDTVDRIPAIRRDFGSGMCNITKCCSEVCPESIAITDNAIIPLKERVVSRYYDPVLWILRKIFGPKKTKSCGCSK